MIGHETPRPNRRPFAANPPRAVGSAAIPCRSAACGAIPPRVAGSVGIRAANSAPARRNAPGAWGCKCGRTHPATKRTTRSHSGGFNPPRPSLYLEPVFVEGTRASVHVSKRSHELSAAPLRKVFVPARLATDDRQLPAMRRLSGCCRLRAAEPHESVWTGSHQGQRCIQYRCLPAMAQRPRDPGTASREGAPLLLIRGDLNQLESKS